MPCNTTAPSRRNPPILVIWYKQGSTDPVYSYDLRGRGPEKAARHWADAHALNGRANFQMANKKMKAKGVKSFLRIRNVHNLDRGLFRCRVDFQSALTRNSRANLTVIGKLHDKT